MSKIEDDLKWEDSRSYETPAAFAAILLCQSGGFWRAYSRSAWLLLNLSRKMKVHVIIRNGVKIAQVGFPVTSVAGWLPNGYSFEVSSEGFAYMEIRG